MWATYDILEIGDREPKTCKELLLIAVIFLPEENPERTAAELIRFYRNALSNKLLQPTRNDGASYL